MAWIGTSVCFTTFTVGFETRVDFTCLIAVDFVGVVETFGTVIGLMSLAATFTDLIAWPARVESSTDGNDWLLIMVIIATTATITTIEI